MEDMVKSEVFTGPVAIVVTIVGGLLTTAVNWGSTHARLTAVETHQQQQDQQLEGVKRDITDTKVSAAAANQKLDDVKSQLDRIEKKL